VPLQIGKIHGERCWLCLSYGKQLAVCLLDSHRTHDGVGQPLVSAHYFTVYFTHARTMNHHVTQTLIRSLHDDQNTVPNTKSLHKLTQTTTATSLCVTSQLGIIMSSSLPEFGALQQAVEDHQLFMRQNEDCHQLIMRQLREAHKWVTAAATDVWYL